MKANEKADELTTGLIKLIKTAGAEMALASRPEAEIRRYLAHMAAHDCLSWCGDGAHGGASGTGQSRPTTVHAFGLLTVWPVAHDFLAWCPDEPVVGAYPEWEADTLYIGELIVTGPAMERGRQLQAMVRCLAAKHPEAMGKPWRAHRRGTLVLMDKFKAQFTKEGI